MKITKERLMEILNEEIVFYVNCVKSKKIVSKFLHESKHLNHSSKLGLNKEKGADSSDEK